MAREADHVIYLHAGEEKSVAATKTYTTSLARHRHAERRRGAGPGRCRITWNSCRTSSQQTLAWGQASAAAERYRYMRVCVVIGRGFNYATAFETALEDQGTQLRHGRTLQQRRLHARSRGRGRRRVPHHPLRPTGASCCPRCKNFIRNLKERGAETIVISDDDETLALARTPFELPVSVPEWLSPILSILPGQLFAMHLANVRDYDVDRPRGLRKVTETR